MHMEAVLIAFDLPITIGTAFSPIAWANIKPFFVMLKLFPLFL